MEHLQLKLKEKILIDFVIWLTECLMMTVAMRTFCNIFTANDSFATVITIPGWNTMAPP